MKNNNEITGDLYKGSNLEKSFNHQEPLTFEKAEQTIRNNYERNLIDRTVFEKALEELDILKAEGGRGGKVIGHTKSGKAIYETKTAKHINKYTSKDHEDAAYAHLDHAEKLTKEGKKEAADRHNAHFDEHMSESKHKAKQEEIDKKDK